MNEKMADEKSEQLAYSVSVIPVRRINASDSTIEKVGKEKLAVNCVKVLKLYTERSMNGIFSRCDAHMEPVQKKQIDAKNFEFENCRVIPMFGG